jgi:hypothetical protein
MRLFLSLLLFKPGSSNETCCGYLAADLARCCEAAETKWFTCSAPRSHCLYDRPVCSFLWCVELTASGNINLGSSNATVYEFPILDLVDMEIMYEFFCSSRFFCCLHYLPCFPCQPFSLAQPPFSLASLASSFSSPSSSQDLSVCYYTLHQPPLRSLEGVFTGEFPDPFVVSETDTTSPTEK